MQLHDDVNEFVFKRRRRRLRINVQLEDSGVVVSETLDQASDVGVRSGLIPDIAVLPEPATSSPAFTELLEPSSPGASSETIVTVERFLRYSNQAVRKTKQVVPGNVAPRRPRVYTRKHAAGRRVMPTRKVLEVPKRPKRSSRVAKALFRATVLTDGDPVDTLMDDAGISHTRRPLKFVPFNKFASPKGLDKTDSVKPSDPGREEDTMVHARRIGGTLDSKAHPHRSSRSHLRTPLHLVPLQEAEAAYSVIFPHGTCR